jgi:hypothetical protein
MFEKMQLIREKIKQHTLVLLLLSSMLEEVNCLTSLLKQASFQKKLLEHISIK